MTKTNPLEIHDIHALMELVSLQEIRYFELKGAVTGPPSDEAADPELLMEYSEYVDDESIHCRFRFTVKTSDAEFVSDIASVFETSKPVKVDRIVLNDFAERVGFMAAFPYLRESLTTTASRMGRRAPLIGLMRPGDLKIEMIQDASTQAAEGSSDVSTGT